MGGDEIGPRQDGADLKTTLLKLLSVAPGKAG